MIVFSKVLNLIGFNNKPKIRKEKTKNNNENWKSKNPKGIETSINPATGFPMIGSLDVAGNSIGSSTSDFHRSNYDDYHGHQPIKNNFDYNLFNQPW